MSGLEAAPLLLEFVIPAAFKVVMDWKNSDADHFIRIAEQVNNDLELAKRCFVQVDDLLRPHQDLKIWIRITFSRTQKALDEFVEHLPIVRKDRKKASLSLKTEYFFNKDKVSDLEKALKCSHSALLTAIGLMCQIPLHKSLATADQTTVAPRASSMLPCIVPRPQTMTEAQELA